MHIFQNSNTFFNCLDKIHINLRLFVHLTKIICSIWHNLTSKYYYFKKQFTHYSSDDCLFIPLQSSNYQLIQLLKMISNCLIIITVFYNHFATNFRTWMSFFTKLKTVITCNTGCPMFKTLHCAFISLKKYCTCTITGSKKLYIVKYHWNITLDHPHTSYP